MTQGSMIIIGAGIAGLSAGCYGQMNGYRTQIFEMHNLPGGLCTSWKRKGYTFDGCIHHLAGASRSSKLYAMWKELGAVQERPFIHRDFLVQVEDPTGKAFTVYTDIDRLEQHMKELAPADAAVIDEYIRAAWRFTGLDLLALPAAKPPEMVGVLPFVPALIKWGKITLETFATRFSDPFLRRAFPTIQYDFPDIPMLLHLNFVASCHNQTLGWPTGGSQAFSQAIAKRYRDLGGELHYKSPVAKILVENDRAPSFFGHRHSDGAIGVRLADGSEHRADTVISAADGHATIFDMLDGAYADDRIRAHYAEPPDRQEMNFHLSLGVARDISQEPHALTYFLDQPATILGEERDRLSVEIYNFDPSMAPAGKSVVKVLLDASYSHWRALHDDRARYKAEKERVAEEIIAHLEQRFPGLREQIEVVDVATPVTVERFTGNWHGLQAWPAEDEGFATLLKGLTRTLPGLENFYMVGQWAGGIGVSTAAIGGRQVIQKICRRDGRKFNR
jgi:phytoene dehydrogenase-like protein